MGIRIASLLDEPIIATWLQNESDCLFATGKNNYSSDMYQSWYEAHDQFGYFLMEDNQVLAYGEIWVDDEEKDLELAHLIVHPSYRNEGIGKQLVQMLQKECRVYPYPWIFLRIDPENIRAQSCYKGAGFTEDSSLRTTFNSKWIWMRLRNGDV